MSKLLSQQETAATHDRRGKLARGNPLAWKPGQSGNPGGRPKGASFAGALARHALRVWNMELVGNYALKLVFSDGHDTGIYSWDRLYQIPSAR